MKNNIEELIRLSKIDFKIIYYDNLCSILGGYSNEELVELIVRYKDRTSRHINFKTIDNLIDIQEIKIPEVVKQFLGKRV